MKLKLAATLLVAGLLFGNAAFGQTIQITGTVTAFNNTQITIQSSTDVWTINRTSTTKVTSGTLKVGSVATIQCASTDAHKNEGTTGGTPTPSGS
jgi:hypothetical protein